MKKDRFKDIIESDNTIRLVGKHIVDARKPTKHKEAKIACRSAMHRLERIVDKTKGVSEAAYLLKVQNLYLVEEGIKEVCEADTRNELRSGSSCVTNCKVMTFG